MRRARFACAAALALAAVSAAPALAATLSGPTRLHVLQKVTYKATGLPQGTYALTIERHPRGATCVAYMASRRSAAGTEQFHGSLPNGMQCVRDGHRFSAGVPAGAYRVHVRANGGIGHAFASRSVRVG
jgi:hypothetical protein